MGDATNVEFSDEKRTYPEILANELGIKYCGIQYGLNNKVLAYGFTNSYGSYFTLAAGQLTRRKLRERLAESNRKFSGRKCIDC